MNTRLLDRSFVRDHDFADLREGMSVHFTTRICRTEVGEYAGLCGDCSPLHVDEEFGRQSVFGTNLVHGMLIGSYFSTLVGVLLPGRNALLAGMRVDFVRPISVGSTVTVSGSVASLAPATRTLVLRLLAFVDGEMCVQGEARVKVLPPVRDGAGGDRAVR